MYKPMITALLLLLTAFGWMQEPRRQTTALGRGEMTLEWTPGEEAVVRIAAESEEPLERIRIFLPDDRELVDLHAQNGLRRGLSGLELELRESDLETLLEHYAEGRYEIRADTVSGRLAVGSARLSFDLPPSPLIVHPGPGEVVHGSNLTVLWMADHAAAAYEVELEQGDEDGLRVRLPPEQSSFQVPAGFLQPGVETSLDVVAIGANGNRTVSEVRFMTRP